MVLLSEEQKKMFYTSGYTKKWVLSFTEMGVVVDNSTLHSETPVIMESICDEEDFTLGGCIASLMEYEVSEIIANQIGGLEFIAELVVLEEGGDVALSLPMGIFRVDSAARVDDKDYKLVTAYDRMYDASVDVSEWYKGYFSEGAIHTVKETRESLLRHLKIPFVEQVLLNDNVPLFKKTEPAKGTLPGTDVLRALCVVNAGFGRMNRHGKFEVIHTGAVPLFPEEDLYPENNLYPEDTFAYLGTSGNGGDVPQYRSIRYEDYITQKISCLYIQTESELIQVGNDTSNPYIISSNFLLQGKGAAELQEIGRGIFDRIKDVVYRPNTTELTGLPYMEVGDAFGLIKRTDIVESFIFSRTLSKIQALKDTYEAKGSELRANELTVSERVDQLQGKTDAIEESVEGVTEDVEAVEEEVAELEKKSNARFEIMEDSIEAEVTRATEEEGDLSARISITAEEISSEVTRARNEENILSTRIVQAAEAIKLEASKTYESKEHAVNSYADLHSQITVSADKIESNVRATYETKKDAYNSYVEMESSVTQMAGQISTKVSRGEVVSEINQSPEEVIIKSNRFTLESTELTIKGGHADFGGNLSGASGTFRGSITATSGEIGDFTIRGGSLSSYRTQLQDGYISSTDISATQSVSARTMSCTGPLYAEGAARTTTTNKTNIVVINTSTGELKLSESSSKRYKHDITPLITDELSPKHLYDIPVNEYVFNEGYLEPGDPRYNKKVIGLIAEEVEKHYPIAAEKNDYGEIENWNDRYLIPPMLSLIQRQHEEIEILKTEFAALSCEFSLLKQRMEGLMC